MENLENKENIDIYFTSNEKEEKRHIKMDKRSIFTFFNPFHITLIEILDSDNISKDIFLYPDLNYKKSYSFYLKKNYYIAGFENNHKKFISSFNLNDIFFFEFNGDINDKDKFGIEFNDNKNEIPEEFCSIICSKNNFNVIGIKKGGFDNNGGAFIGKILDYLENERKGINVNNAISMYTGMFSYGLRHGKGTGFYVDGGVYEGEWINDSREGEGTMYYTNGNIYIGNWKNNRREGYGTFYFCRGGIYKGEFNNNIIDGRGELTVDNGRFIKSYTGTLRIEALDDPNFDAYDLLTDYFI
jgi:hypothetical protein